MERSWLVDSWAIARKVKNVSLPPASQIKDCGAKSECPNCHHSIDNSDVSPEWPGLPAGVKFDPSEVELLEHLRTKCGAGSSDHTHFLTNSYQQLNQVMEYITPILRIFLDTGKPSHRLECNQQYNECLAGKSQLEEYDETCEIDCFLLCRELVSQSHFSAKSNFVSHAKIAQKNEITASFDTPPDFIHPELPFGSQESIFDWLDRL